MWRNIREMGHSLGCRAGSAPGGLVELSPTHGPILLRSPAGSRFLATPRWLAYSRILMLLVLLAYWRGPCPECTREDLSMCTIGSVVLGLLITAIAGGCANYPPGALQRPVPQPEPTRAPKETQAPPGSDRIRDDNTQAPTRSPAPASSPQSPPQPVPPSHTPPVQRQEEPDPRDVIDWLLRERR
jgi:hypothetical protein